MGRQDESESRDSIHALNTTYLDGLQPLEIDSDKNQRSKTQDSWIISILFLIISPLFVILVFDYIGISTQIIPNYLWWIISGVSFLLCYKLLDRFYVQNRPDSHLDLINQDVILPIDKDNIHIPSNHYIINFVLTFLVIVFTLNSWDAVQAKFEIWYQPSDTFEWKTFSWLFMIAVYLNLNLFVISIFFIPMLMTFRDTVDKESAIFSKISNQNLNDLLSKQISREEKIKFLKHYSTRNFEWGVKVFLTKLNIIWAGALSEATQWVLLMSYFILVWFLEFDAFSVFFWISFLFIWIIPNYVSTVHTLHGEMVVENMVINRCAELIGDELIGLDDEE